MAARTPDIESERGSRREGSRGREGRRGREYIYERLDVEVDSGIARITVGSHLMKDEHRHPYFRTAPMWYLEESAEGHLQGIKGAATR